MTEKKTFPEKIASTVTNLQKLLRMRSSERKNEKSSWSEKIIEGVSAADKKTLDQVRKSLESDEQNPLWYYSGSSADVTPLSIAPRGTHFHFVDPDFKHDYKYLDNQAIAQRFNAPLTKLLDRDSDTQIVSPDFSQPQRIQIDPNTYIDMVGGMAQEAKTVPEQEVDVIFTNPFSTNPGPEVWEKLKVGGKVVYLGEDHLKTSLLVIDFVKDLGFVRKKTFPEINWSFPTLGKLNLTMYGKQSSITIFEKAREFTSFEEAILHFDSSLWEISYSFPQFVESPIGYQYLSPEQRVEASKQEFTDALNRFKQRLNRFAGPEFEEVVNVAMEFLENNFFNEAQLEVILEEKKNVPFYQGKESAITARFHEALEMYEKAKAA